MTTSFNRKQQLKFTNVVVGCHDLLCNCSSPAVHSIKELITTLKNDLTENDKQQIKQCLGEDTTVVAADHGTDVDTIDFGDLEKLFGEDTEPDDG